MHMIHRYLTTRSSRSYSHSQYIRTRVRIETFIQLGQRAIREHRVNDRRRRAGIASRKQPHMYLVPYLACFLDCHVSPTDMYTSCLTTCNTGYMYRPHATDCPVIKNMTWNVRSEPADSTGCYLIMRVEGPFLRITHIGRKPPGS